MKFLFFFFEYRTCVEYSNEGWLKNLGAEKRSNVSEKKKRDPTKSISRGD